MFSKISLPLFLGILILNPYTVIGPLAYYVAAPFLLFAIITSYQQIAKKFNLMVLILIPISLVGVASSFLHDIGQFEHLKVTLSLIAYLIIGCFISIYWKKKGVSFEDVVFYFFLVIILNSSIVLIQVLYPSFRSAIENIFAASGNIDWRDGFRYRGLASGGGASLSLLAPVSLVMALHLYSQKYINALVLLGGVGLAVVALFFVGRTGVLLLPIPIMLFFLQSRLGSFVKNALAVLVLIFAFILFKDDLQYFLSAAYGDAFYKYSLGYFMNGVEGLREEGTIDIILEFLSVVPSEFPEIFFGYGFYGGGDFYPWTDSGYARMFLSVGYIFGLMYYAIVGVILYRPFKYRPYVFAALIAILLIAETKESLLFSGYAARLLFILAGFALMEAGTTNRLGGMLLNSNRRLADSVWEHR